MPQTIQIGAFVLGSVLLLLALVSGGFKIFGAEVSAATNRLGRVLAFVLGLFFVGVGLLRGSDQPPDVPDAPKKHSDAAPAPFNERSPSPPPMETATRAPNTTIEGIWMDPQSGSIFQVTQTGANTFGFMSTNPMNPFRSWGQSTINGRRVDSTFQTNIPSSGSGTGMLSEDGRQIVGHYRDSLNREYDQTLVRQ